MSAKNSCRRFSHHGDGCTLRIVRGRPSNRMIAALLIFQLAIGLQWQVAHALVVPPERQMNSMDARHCLTHPSKDSRTDERRAAGVSTSAPSSHDDPAHPRGCCGSLDCQCQCAQGPVVLDLPLASVVFPAAFLLPFVNARPPVARTNELFRPPIA